jgi:cytoskeletal protein CcmA (bactofilin family)
MANPRKDGVVDSYTALKAAQRAVRSRAVAAPEPGAETDDLRKLGAQVRQAAVPSKQLIECYECGYRFQLHGRVPKTNCNKCRATLDLSDHSICARWSGALKTAGAVRVSGDGVVEAGSIICNDFILAGAVEAGIVKALRRLELCPGARFSEPNLHAADLFIAAGAHIALIEPAEYRDVEIAGVLRASITASGRVIIRSGGCFVGQLRAARLRVEDGAGLIAQVRP